ncbi:MAG: TonB-dependent receptor, plug [Gammaproteobacteria bacterium]|nr:TonB-dependent receptor, plug [Gammaproteobacteria bacterium]
MTTHPVREKPGQARPIHHRRAFGVRTLSLLAASLLSTFTGRTQADTDAPSTGELKQLSVEELMNIQVTSVARHPEKLLQAAAAIQVITQDDIRRSGASSIPEALRLADNLEVAQKNAHDWAITARGFNTALGNKLLVMIDGRTVYTPLYSGVFWDVQDYLLEDIDRIEVISGPGGTLWGANAVNGVINIITRSAADSQGLHLEAGGGSQLEEFGGARYGGMLSPGVSFRIYGKYFDRGSEVLANGSPAHDGWHQAQGGFRVDSQPSPQDTLSLHGDLYNGHEGVNTGGTAQTSGGNIVGHWAHVFSDRSDMSLQAYYDRTHLVDPVPAFLLGALALAPAGRLQDDLTTGDIDFQHRFAVGARNRIVWGLGYRFTHDAVENAPALGFVPPVLDQNLFSAFVQDEILLGTDWSFILGSKFEHNDYTGFEVEPNVRLEWNLAANQALWSAISRAARTPSRIDRDFSEPAQPSPLVVLAGSSAFSTEYVNAYELGYRAEIGPAVTGSISTFYNVYNDVRSTSFTPNTILPLFFANNLQGDTYGFELSGNYQVLERWSLHAGYNLLRENLHVKPGQFDLSNARNETADPQQQVSVRSSMSLPRHVELDATLRWVDQLLINNGSILGTVPSYFEMDGRLAWHATQGLEFSLTGRNLLHDHHPEYGFPSPTRVAIERSIYGKIAWRY